MKYNEDMIDKLANEVIKKLGSEKGIKIGVSARHVHLSQQDLETLFGKGHELEFFKPLMGGQFAAKETVTIISASMHTIEGVRVLGPVRSRSQVEVSRTDTFKLKNSPPVRPSGELTGSAPIAIAGPCGVVYLNEGCIIANRHIHMSPASAAHYCVTDNDLVDVLVSGKEKKTKFYDVQVRVDKSFDTEMHIDTDDANACGIRTGDYVEICR